MVLRVQTCPTVLRQTVCELFPYRPLEKSELSVITINLRPDIKQVRLNKEIETERMAQMVRYIIHPRYIKKIVSFCFSS